MKKASKNAKIVTSLALIVLAFLCSFNVVSAYFTATANANGSMSFPDLDVRFMYRMNSEFYPTNTDTVDDAVYTINLYPVGGTISRGQEFTLSPTLFTQGQTQEEIQDIVIANMYNSAEAYVRFWIDAYIVNGSTVDTSVNYGKYFFLTGDGEGESYVRGEADGDNLTALAESCYFVPSISLWSGEKVWLGNSLTLKDIDGDPVPNALLGAQLKLTISLQAVQAANDAYLSVFNDARGYHSLWG